MARIKQDSGRSDGNSGYTRLFGIEELGRLIGRIQAACIVSGLQLEGLIQTLMPREQVRPMATVVDQIRSGQAMALPAVTVSFKGRGMTKSLGYEGHADVVVFQHLTDCAIVIELKDGDNFDTKKSAGELLGLQKFAAWLATKTDYSVAYALCSFNQNDPYAIMRGLKGKFSREEVMTGKELCNLLGLNYERVVGLRMGEQNQNVRTFGRALLEIPELREVLMDGIRRQVWLESEQIGLFEELVG